MAIARTACPCGGICATAAMRWSCETVAKLKDLLARADYEPVQALLHWMLVGPWSGRKALTARLGSEANDAIDELLNVAAQYEAAHTASLPGFLHWFDGGDGELKREAGEQANEVRVLTVHGAKGLQAPIVILADATANPDRARPGALTLTDGERTVPLPPVSKGETVAALDDAAELAKARDREEHWRLLYVAMTRAEEALYVGGALGKRDEEPAPDSWYARLAPLMPEETDPTARCDGG